MAEGLHHGGIVSEAVVVGLLIGRLQELDVEGLGCLHQPILIARHRY